MKFHYSYDGKTGKVCLPFKDVKSLLKQIGQQYNDHLDELLQQVIQEEDIDIRAAVKQNKRDKAFYKQVIKDVCHALDELEESCKVQGKNKFKEAQNGEK